MNDRAACHQLLNPAGPAAPPPSPPMPLPSPSPALSPPLPSKHNRLTTIALVSVLLLAAVVRFAQLGRASLWFDEGYTAWVISLSPRQLIAAIRVDTAPPLFYLLLRQCTHWVGRSEAGLRSLSALCSLSAVGVCGWTAHRLLRHRWATLAATALAAAAYMPVAYAHEARFYAMMLLLGAVDFLLVVLAAQRVTPVRLLMLWLFWTASVYTNNILILYVAGSAAAWLMLPGAVPRRRRAWQLAAVGAAVVLAFSPWIGTMFQQQRSIQGNFWVSPPQLWDLGDTVCSLTGIDAHRWPILETVIVAVDGLVAILCIAGLLRRCWTGTAAALGTLALAPVLLLFLVSRISQSIFIDRIFLPSCAFTPILLAMPLAWLEHRLARRMWAACLVVLLVAEACSIQGQMLGEHHEDWRSAVRFVQQQRARSPGRSAVLFIANEGETLYDYYARDSDYSRLPDLLGAPSDFFTPQMGGPPRTMRRVYTDADLAPLRATLAAAGFDHIFLVQSHETWADRGHRVLAMLKQQMHAGDQRHFAGITVLELDRVQ